MSRSRTWSARHERRRTPSRHGRCKPSSRSCLLVSSKGGPLEKISARWARAADGARWARQDDGARWARADDGARWTRADDGARWTRADDGARWARAADRALLARDAKTGE